MYHSNTMNSEIIYISYTHTRKATAPVFLSPEIVAEKVS